MNWAALLLVGLGVLGLTLAVTGGWAPVAKLLFGPAGLEEKNTATNPITPSTPTPRPSGPKSHDPGVTLAVTQLQAALAAYAPGGTL